MICLSGQLFNYLTLFLSKPSHRIHKEKFRPKRKKDKVENKSHLFFSVEKSICVDIYLLEKDKGSSRFVCVCVCVCVCVLCDMFFY